MMNSPAEIGRKVARRATLVLLLTAVTLPCGGQPISKICGLNFSPYGPGEDPNAGAVVSRAQIHHRLAIVAPYTTWIRTFGSTNGVEHAAEIAHGMKLKTAVGAWIGRDRNANAREIANVRAMITAGNVDLAIIGSETLLRRDASAADIVRYLNEVRRAHPAVVLGYADIYQQLLANPSVVQASDVVLANIYPYWEGVPVSNAVGMVADRYTRLAAAFPRKTIVISETGWPSRGEAVGQAIPSPENQEFYLRSFAAWASANNVPYFFFEAFDEAWKQRKEGLRGGAWGIWDEQAHLKANLESALVQSKDSSLQFCRPAAAPGHVGHCLIASSRRLKATTQLHQ